VRSFWYVVEALLERPDVSKCGVVVLIGLGSTEKAHWNIDRTYTNLVKQLISTMPYNIMAIHHVVVWRMVEFVVPFLLYLLRLELRYRYKCYRHSEHMYIELAKCGINRDILPVENGGTDRDYNFTDWIEYRRSRDL
jgi:hypothetical protein